MPNKEHILPLNLSPFLYLGDETEMDGKIILPELTVAKLDHHSVEFTWEGSSDSHYTGKNR